jgi:hypothetical protein
MKRIWLALAGACATAVMFVVPGVAAGAGSTTCTTSLDPGSYGRVTVPAGEACFSPGGVTIRGGLYVEPGATFVLGSEDPSTAPSTISGGVHATDPANLQVHFATIQGGLVSIGGSGPEGGPFGITWTTIEDSTINGGVAYDGYNGFWAGFIRNTVNGGVHFADNTVVDPDGNEIVTNTIHGNLVCSGNTPTPQAGDSEGDVNVVTGRRIGDCGNV